MSDSILASTLAFSVPRIRNSPLPSYPLLSTSLITRRPLRIQLLRSNASNPDTRPENFGFKEKENKDFELKRPSRNAFLEKSQVGSGDSLTGEEGNRENLVRVEDGESSDFDKSTRRKREVVRRSRLLAKQVISVHSALSLGFVSQLWVDPTSWVVLVVEVRPSLLSGESERFLLQDVYKVGDVVLVKDESVMENDVKMIGLETLVGYRVVTPGRRNIGKVRGYTFNIDSGAVESLELDSFGISIIPSSLVSTYALVVEDVLEVLADTVVVHEAAASRMQRLTKGFLDPPNGEGVVLDDYDEYSDYEMPVRPDDSWSPRRKSKSKKQRLRRKEIDEDWDLPMDYF